MAEIQLTVTEHDAIRQLQALAQAWPSSLWLFSASGSLHVMRKVNGKRMMNKHDGGIDADYVVETIKGIDNDGGDW